MALSIITGTVGAGKTCFSTFLTHDAADQDYHIYANYEIKGIKYKPLHDLEDLLEMKTYPNFIVMDEGWINADSRRSMAAHNLLTSHKVLQHRKGMDKKELIKRGHKVENEVVITSQTLGQIDLRLLSVVKNVYETRVLLHDPLGKPLCLWVSVLNVKGKPGFPIPMQFQFKHGWIDVPESFNTFQEVETLDNSKANFKRFEPYMKKYKDFQGKKTELADILWMKEGLPHSEAGYAAGYIIAERDGLI